MAIKIFIIIVLLLSSINVQSNISHSKISGESSCFTPSLVLMVTHEHAAAKYCMAIIKNTEKIIDPKKFPKKAHVDYSIQGQRFGMLVVIKLSYLRQVRYGEYAKYWECKCDCGKVINTSQSYFQRMYKKDCGCENRKKILATNTTHGDSQKRLYCIYKGIIARCKYKNIHNGRYYKKGIKVCDEWMDYNVFKKWSLENGYSDGLSIDRINNNGNYEPLNCRWADAITQANNKDINVIIEYDGKKQTLAQWSREVGIKDATIRGRLSRGWDIENTLTKPIRKITGVHI